MFIMLDFDGSSDSAFHLALIHFEFIFVNGFRECSNFILFHVAVQFSQHHLLKKLSFFQLIIDVRVYFQTFYSVLRIYIFVFLLAPYCFDDCGFVVQPEVREPDFSSSFSFPGLLWLLGFLKLFFIYFYFFQGCTRGIWKFPGQRSNWSFTCWPTPQPQQHRIQATSVIYAKACSNIGSLTH